MLRRLEIAALLSMTAALAGELPESVIQLARVKSEVTRWLEHLPNYTCLVTVQRTAQSRPGRAFNPVDTMWYDIAHSDGRELFAWPGSRRFAERPITTAITYGVISDGEFALHANTVFAGGYSTIRFHRIEALNGRDTLRWDFVIPLFGSGWTITNAGREAHVSSHGSFWIASESLELMRLEVHADGIPPDFPDTAAITTMDYGRVRIAARDVLLPQTATLVLDERSGARNRNIMEFSHCRQYAGESSLKFDVEHSQASFDGPTESAEGELPAGVSLRLQLSDSIDSRTATVGDPVKAVLVSDAIQQGMTLVPRDATLRGRLRGIDRRMGPPVQYVIEVEFIELEFSGKRMRFFGDLKRLEGSVNGLRRIARSSIPGTATLVFEGSSFQLPKGTVMLWTSGILKQRERPHLQD